LKIPLSCSYSQTLSFVCRHAHPHKRILEKSGHPVYVEEMSIDF
jgi:hypothetical protein